MYINKRIDKIRSMDISFALDQIQLFRSKQMKKQWESYYKYFIKCVQKQIKKKPVKKSKKIKPTKEDSEDEEDEDLEDDIDMTVTEKRRTRASNKEKSYVGMDEQEDEELEEDYDVQPKQGKTTNNKRRKEIKLKEDERLSKKRKLDLEKQLEENEEKSVIKSSLKHSLCPPKWIEFVVEENGFDDYETFGHITQEDLQQLKVPLGHIKKILNVAMKVCPRQ